MILMSGRAMLSGSKDNSANWPCMGLGKVTKAADVKRVKKWLSDNCEDAYIVRTILETQGKRRVTIATFVRMRSEADALMFKLAWLDYE